MKGSRLVIRAVVAAALAMAGSQVHAACTFNGSGEPSLQGTLDSLLGAGALSATGDCVADGRDAAWSTVGNTAAASILIELAGNASSNTFGVYDLADPNRRLTIFEGNDAVSSFANLRVAHLNDGSWRISVREFNNPDDPNGWTAMNMATSAFGFYLSTASNGTFFSNSALNGEDHLYAYAGAGTAFLSGPLADEVFDVNDFILAWEDLAGGGDRDFQDFVAVVQDVTPVPLPTAVWLFASGLIGLVGVARRRA